VSTAAGERTTRSSRPPAPPLPAGRRRVVWPLVAVLAVGAAVRVYAMVGYSPSVLQWVDGIRYARIGEGFFDEYWWPAGYPAFLLAARSVTNWLPFTIALQHALGLGAAGLLYATVRRLGAPVGVALVPAGIAALSGDFVYLEHIVMAEQLFTFMLVAGLYCAVRGLVADDRRWLAAAAVVLTLAGLVRTTGLVLPFVLAAVVLFDRRPGRRGALASAGRVAAVAVVLVAGYMGVASTGRYAGLFDMGGWHLYARIAPTADCRTFTPPRGTRFLCETTPVAERPGSFWYEWEAASPARKHFTFPDGNAELGRFARAYITAHPLSYAKIVVKDSLRSIEPSLGRDRIESGIPGDVLVFGFRLGTTEQTVGRALEHKYRGVLPVRAGGAEVLDSYQRATRIAGLERLVLIALALLGMWAARGVVRRAIVLLTLSAAAVVVLPAVTLSYDIRYALPAILPLSAAAAAGAWAFWERRTAR
jgi:hypothetical protein